MRADLSQSSTPDHAAAERKGIFSTRNGELRDDVDVGSLKCDESMF